MHDVAVLVGSLRRDSLNLKLARALAKLGKGRFNFNFAELGDLPIYNQDMEADLPASVVRMKKEGFVPDRDIILALTADEEGGKSNGIDWLLRNHRELVEAEFVLNHDGGGILANHGRPLLMRSVQRSPDLRSQNGKSAFTGPTSAPSVPIALANSRTA